ncbi:MAG: hypothetical protein JXJ20_00710 [Anaerolineae bacterium]|nr:hypothetical protein [Anaerolineae bacterium]
MVPDEHQAFSSDITHQTIRFVAWNPVDHLRLVWWQFVIPRKAILYHGQVGDLVFFRHAARSAITLAWLPLLIVIIGHSLGSDAQTPVLDIDAIRLPFWTWIGIVGLGWALSQFIAHQNNCLLALFLWIPITCLAFVGTGLIAAHAEADNITVIAFLISSIVTISLISLSDEGQLPPEEMTNPSGTTASIITILCALAVMLSGFDHNIHATTGLVAATVFVGWLVLFTVALILTVGIAKYNGFEPEIHWPGRAVIAALLLAYALLALTQFV